MGEACRNCGRDPCDISHILSAPTRLCTKCGLMQPLPYFRKAVKSSDKLNAWCRDCGSKYAKLRRQGLKAHRDAQRNGIPDKWTRGQPDLSAATEAKVWRLLTAAATASSAGRWSGHEGISAYRELRAALDEWRVPEQSEEPIWLEEA